MCKDQGGGGVWLESWPGLHLPALHASLPLHEFSLPA